MTESAAIVTTHRTRAQVMRDKVQIRFATEADGVDIERLLKNNNIELGGTDWTTCTPHWLIAQAEGKVIGCILVLTARPFGFLEFMFVEPSASFKLRAIAIRKLTSQGAVTLATYGCSYMLGFVDKANAKFEEVLKKNGMSRTCEAVLMRKHLQPYKEAVSWMAAAARQQ